MPKKFIFLFLVSTMVLGGCALGGGGLSGGDGGSSRGTGQPAKVGAKCASDANCGVGACSKERDQSIQATCVDGKCAAAAPQACAEGEICLVDSRGAKCYDKAAFTQPRPTIGCIANTGSARVGFNPFSAFNARCQDDCNPPRICDAASCTCEDPPGNPPAPCPAPEFYYQHEMMDAGITAPDFTFLNTSDIFYGSLAVQPDPEQLVLIPAFRDVSSVRNQIFPFPDEQFQVIPPPLPENIRGVYCANDHYDADQALAVDINWIPRPSGELDVCRFGNSDQFDGILRICMQDLLEWFEEYSFQAPDMWDFVPDFDLPDLPDIADRGEKK